MFSVFITCCTVLTHIFCYLPLKQFLLLGLLFFFAHLRPLDIIVLCQWSWHMIPSFLVLLYVHLNILMSEAWLFKSLFSQSSNEVRSSGIGLQLYSLKLAPLLVGRWQFGDNLINWSIFVVRKKENQIMLMLEL